jgi:hypothetical protein
VELPPSILKRLRSRLCATVNINKGIRSWRAENIILNYYWKDRTYSEAASGSAIPCTL